MSTSSAGLVKRCGDCRFAKFIPQDVTRRVCIGAPATAMVVPTPKGVMQQNTHPIVSVTDEACALRYIVDFLSDHGLKLPMPGTAQIQDFTKENKRGGMLE